MTNIGVVELADWKPLGASGSATAVVRSSVLSTLLTANLGFSRVYPEPARFGTDNSWVQIGFAWVVNWFQALTRSVDRPP
jgi:hypothetical protein